MLQNVECKYFFGHIYSPKTNTEPKNRGLEDDFPFDKGEFLSCMLLWGVAQTWSFLHDGKAGT